MSYFQNPYKYTINKYLFDMLQERFGNHTLILERLTHYMVTEQDMIQFCTLAADVYQTGYMKAIVDYQEQVKQKGYDIEVTHELKPKS